MADLGDYVQHRKYPKIRGEVVNKNKDGWCMVQIPDFGFVEHPEKDLITIVKGKNG